MENESYVKTEETADGNNASSTESNGIRSAEKSGDVSVKMDQAGKKSKYPDKPHSAMTKEELLYFSNTPFWKYIRLSFFIAFWLGWVALLATVVAMTITSPRCQDPPKVQWWQSAPFYQVYVRSFYDSDGDGVGDIRGIIEKLSYLKDINVHGIIVSSFYESHVTDADFGYDVINHTNVDIKYGNLTDVEDLIQKAHENYMKIIFDFIPNHTGTLHPWFIASNGASPGTYVDYYVWEECLGQLPNNWKSIYTDSITGDGMLAWSEGDDLHRFDQCYFHQGLSSQPDLNLRSSRVQDELKSILRFWLDRGVDGFRVTHARYLMEDYELKDEPLINSAHPKCAIDADNTPYECYDHIYTASQETNFALIAQWRAVLEEYNDRDPSRIRIIFTDAKETTNITIQYYGANGQDGANLALNYGIITELQDGRCNGLCVDELVSAWLEWKDADITTNWMTSHHDEPRLDPTYSEALLTLKLTLPGSSILYYGEEIGMINGDTSSMCLDGAGSPGGFCRDCSRTPMQWNSGPSAGFSNNTSTWLAVNPDYNSTNVQVLQDSEDAFNVLKVYMKLAGLQTSSTAFQYGKHETVIVTSEIYSFLRYFDGTDRYLITMNLGLASSLNDYTSVHSLVPDSALVVASNAGWGPDSSVNLKSLQLEPDQYVVCVWPYERS